MIRHIVQNLNYLILTYKKNGKSLGCVEGDFDAFLKVKLFFCSANFPTGFLKLET